jgi:hypothetical protein
MSPEPELLTQTHVSNVESNSVNLDWYAEHAKMSFVDGVKRKDGCSSHQTWEFPLVQPRRRLTSVTHKGRVTLRG